MTELFDFDRSSSTSLEQLQDRVVVWTRNLKNLLGANKASPGFSGERSLRNNIYAWASAQSNGASDPTLIDTASYNVSAVARTTTGTYQFTVPEFTRSDSTGSSVICIPNISSHSGGPFDLDASDADTTTIQLRSYSSGSLTDLANGTFMYILVVGY